MPVLHTSTFIRRSPAECREIVSLPSLTPSQSAALIPSVQTSKFSLSCSILPVRNRSTWQPLHHAQWQGKLSTCRAPVMAPPVGYCMTLIEPQLMSILLSTSRARSKSEAEAKIDAKLAVCCARLSERNSRMLIQTSSSTSHPGLPGTPDL